MKRGFCITVLFLVLFFSLSSASRGAESDMEMKWNSLDFQKYFQGYKGCFVLYDMQENKYYRFNKDLCKERLSPCSTFKIPNSLIGLETGVLQDENTLFKWNGNEYFIKEWNQDHTLKSAMVNSVVWYYQILAEQVGVERMQKYLDEIGYGNKDISAGITTFWLRSSLLISADEEVDFITRLYRDELPFQKRNMDIVKNIIVRKTGEDFVFSGKTGGGYENSQWILGWFAGHVKKGDGEFTFAVNIREGDSPNGVKAQDIAKAILTDLNLIQN